MRPLLASRPSTPPGPAPSAPRDGELARRLVLPGRVPFAPPPGTVAGRRREGQGSAMEQGEAAPPAAEEKGGEEEDDFGYRLFPDRNKKPQSFLVRSLFTFHNRCQLMLRMTLDTSKRFPREPGPGAAEGALGGTGDARVPRWNGLAAAVTLGRRVPGRELLPFPSR